MYIENVRLPYTLWYDGKDKIFRMDMSTILPEEHYEDGKKYVGKIRNVHVGGYNVEGDVRVPVGEDGQNYRDVSEFATAVYNEEKHYVDITLKAFPSFNADGEIILYIDYEFAKGIEEYLTDYSFKNKTAGIIIPIRSHENPSKDPGRFANGIGIDKLDVRNGFAHTVGANEEPIVFSFELIERDITDEFITNGQALDMVKNKAVENAVLRANDTGLGISLNYKSYNQLSWDTLKQYLGGSNPTEYVATTLEDVLSMLDNADLNNNNRLTSIIALGLRTNISVQENGSKDIDVNYTTTYYDADVRNPTTRNYTLFTIPRSLLGAEVDMNTVKQEVLDDINPRIPDKDALKSYIIKEFLKTNFIKDGMNSGNITAHDINELFLNGPEESDEVTNTILSNFKIWQKHLIFIKHDDYYEVAYQDTGLAPRMLLKIPFSELRELSSGGTQIDVESLKNEIYSKVGEHITYNDLNMILTSFSNPEDHTYANEIITALLGKYYNQSDEYYTQHPEEIENGFGNKLINHTTNLLDKITKDAADREKAGKLFQKLLDAETLNVVEKTDGYELSYTGDVNKVLVKIPKQAITVSQEVITAALTENVVTETIKPTLDKSYYSKQEVDQLIQQLKHELMSEDHGEEHPQQ